MQLDTEHRKEIVVMLKSAVKITANANREWKMWLRHWQSAHAKGLQFDDPKPDKQYRYGTRRATLLCTALAHSRGRLHCRKLRVRGQNDPIVVTTTDEQLKLLEDEIGEVEKVGQIYKRAIEEGRFYPSLTSEELSAVKDLIHDDGTSGRRHHCPREDDGNSPTVATGDAPP